MSSSIDKEEASFKGLNINEIENILRTEFSSHIVWMINALLASGRINGNPTKILQRIENEAIKIVREHWVR